MDNEALERMLSPVSADRPCGEDLRTSTSSRRLFDELKDARRNARDTERGAPDPGKGQPEDYYFQESLGSWREVGELAPKILAEYSKDLEVASLLIEAEVRLHGFTGLRDGFRLVRELIERFWECLHPMPDEDGIITRVASLSSLNGEGRDGMLIGPIIRAPLTDADKAMPIAHWQWIRECELPSLPEEKNAGYEKLKRLASETDPAFFEKTSSTLSD